MFKRFPFLLPVLAVLVVLLAACGQGGGDGVTPAPLPTSTLQSLGQSTGAPANASVAAPLAGGSGEGSLLSLASSTPAEEALTTVDVGKLLTPSIVQVVTEISAMDSFNQPGPSRGVDTGVTLDELGHILTNNHVIAGAQSVVVTLNNGDSFPAQLVGGDVTTDTAVIRIDADGLQPAALGRSAGLQVGEEVIAIGHALGLPGGPTVSKGVVSALGRSIDVDPRTTMVDLIQTDASINPGNSGGPLSNARGEVIGINTAVIRGSQGIGFAINIDDAQFVVAQLLERGYVDRGFLGIAPVNLSAALAGQVGVPVSEGILVVRVNPDSAAANAGLRAEDVIVRLGDETIANTGELSKFLVAHLPGETVRVVFYRGDDERTVQLTLGTRPKE